MNKAVEHPPPLRDKLAAVDDSYVDIQQDILETFVDRGHLQRLEKPTLTPSGKPVPGLKLDNPRQLALMHALVRFAQIPAACLVFLKLFDRVYATLTAGLLDPIPGDTALPKPKRSSLDRLYQRVSDSLDRLLRTLGLAFSPPINENKIPVDAPIMG